MGILKARGNNIVNIIKSIISIKFYNEIYKKNIWRNILYAFILSLLVYYAGVFVTLGKMGMYIKTELGVFITNLPQFKIEDGILDVKTEKPLIIGKDGYAFIIDDKNKTKTSEYSEYKSIVYFGQASIIVKSGINKNEFKYKDILQNLKLQSIDKDKLLLFLPIIKGTIIKYAIIFYIFWFVFWLLFYKIWSILFLSLIALIIDSFAKSGLTYKGLFSISLYAITLPWILKFVYKAVGINNYINGFFFFVVYWVVASTYVYYVIKEIKATGNLVNEKSDEEFEKLEVSQKIDEFTLD